MGTLQNSNNSVISNSKAAKTETTAPGIALLKAAVVAIAAVVAHIAVCTTSTDVYFLQSSYAQSPYKAPFAFFLFWLPLNEN